MASLKHTHQYHRINIGVKKTHLVYACADPYCTHYMHGDRQIVGKASICWGCRKEFIIQRDSRGKVAKKPKCLECIKRKARDNGLSESEVKNLLEPPIDDTDLEDEEESEEQDIPSVRRLLGLE